MTVQVALIPLSSERAIISAEPAALAVTLPSSTVATDAFELLHIIFLLVALLGDTVAEIVADPFLVKLKLD